MKTVAEAWAAFEAEAIVPEAGAMQRRDLKRAFYFGALTVTRIGSEHVSGGDVCTAEDEALAAAIIDELEAFLADVEAGRA